MYEAARFMNLRQGIIKNAILNKLTAGVVMHTERFEISVTLHTTQEAKQLAYSYHQSLPNHCPNYGMADIIVSISNNIARIGYCFQKIELPIVWESQTFEIHKMMDLKRITEYAYSRYPIHSCKTDPIFSDMPASLATLLESSNISSNVWKTGLRKKIKNVSISQINAAELETYYKRLKLKYDEWRICNTILVGLYKRGNFEATNQLFGTITVNSLVNGRAFIKLYNKIDANDVSMIVPVIDICPITFYSSDAPITITDILQFSNP